ncbi:ABC transporter permease [Rhodococcus sp. WS4]|nr:ABC transporter permease [Rhodococcus sp. WS4]
MSQTLAPSVSRQRSALIERRPGAAEQDLDRYLRTRRRKDAALRFGAPVLLVVLWQIVSMSGLVDQRFWPAPTAVFEAFVESLQSGQLLDALGVSVSRILVGFAFGAVAGIVGGLALGSVRGLRIALEPTISALYTVPKLALLPLLLLIFGLGDTPKIILIALAVFFIVVISTTAAVSGVPESYREPARSFGASRFQTFRHVIAPAIIPEVFVGLRIAAGNAVLVLIGIEFVQGGAGLGWMIWNSWQLFAADTMYVGIITVALLGAVFQSAIMLVGRLSTPWIDSNS